MSGDCKNQPIVFYSTEMTISKMILLSQKGIKFEVEEFKKQLTKTER
jgi:hypothetical protein